MEGIIYQKGHKLPIDLVLDILKNLGCEDIKGNDYHEGSEECDSYNKIGFQINNKKLTPDFLCHYKEESTV